MHADAIARTSRELTWLLRHGAIRSGLPMDAAGWCAVESILEMTGLSRDHLEEVVAMNNKARFQLNGERIRASQGHSLAGTPVTLAALEASWSPWTGSTSLWHGTHAKVIPSIAREGLLAQGRTHVHLVETCDSRVGRRSGVGLVLEIVPDRVRAAGQAIHRSSNGVILIRHVPPESIIALHPLSSQTQREAQRLRAVLGL